jgi:hypothetical protein
MTSVLSISVLGALILLLGIRLIVQSRRRAGPAVTIEDYENARDAIESVFIETAAINRIFSADDAEFITRSATPEVQRLFFKERKKLALQWLRRTRRQVARLMDIHLRLASHTHDPSPGFELMLTARYLGFIVFSDIAWFLLRLQRVSSANRTFSYTVRNASNFCDTFRLRIERVNRDGLSSSPESLVH